MKPSTMRLENFFTVIKRDSAANVYTVRATADRIDRQRERVIPSGCRNLDHFLKYGSILADHTWSLWSVIGKPVGAKMSDRELLVDIAFADTKVGQEAKYLYDQKFVSSFSIGFLPDFEQIDMIDGIRTYKAWDLLELSGVVVPALDTAVMLHAAGQRRGAPLLALSKALTGPEDDDLDDEDEDSLELEDELQDEIKAEEEQLSALEAEINALSGGAR